jgi:HPt (histidine-containing phosphotransfer) domain-containing protein
LVRPRVSSLRAELDALVAEYQRELPQKLAHLEALLAAGRVATLKRELHTLAGSAGTFGLPRLGQAAGAAEAYLASCGASLDGAQRTELGRLLALLKEASATIGRP